MNFFSFQWISFWLSVMMLVCYNRGSNNRREQWLKFCEGKELWRNCNLAKNVLMYLFNCSQAKLVVLDQCNEYYREEGNLNWQHSSWSHKVTFFIGFKYYVIYLFLEKNYCKHFCRAFLFNLKAKLVSLKVSGFFLVFWNNI